VDDVGGPALVISGVKEADDAHVSVG